MADNVFGIIFGQSTTTSSTGISGAVNQYNYDNTYTTIHYYYYIPQTLKTVRITDATQIPENAFYNCDFIESIELNEGIESIGARAFYNCKALTKIVIPDSVTTIGNTALDRKSVV